MSVDIISVADTLVADVVLVLPVKQETVQHQSHTHTPHPSLVCEYIIAIVTTQTSSILTVDIMQ